jgi:hypothetical protein
MLEVAKLYAVARLFRRRLDKSGMKAKPLEKVAMQL